MRALLLLNGSEARTTVKLKEETLFGRSEECSIRSTSPVVSRKHCRIFLKEDKTFIEDLKSTNGTFVNGVMIQSPTELHENDKITAAIIEFKFINIPEDVEVAENIAIDNHHTTVKNENP